MRVVVNAAMSVDGKLATRRREQLRISGDDDLDRVDAFRAEVDAVLVGVGTVLADDPSLTVEEPGRIEDRVAAGQPRQPARVVADSTARTPVDSQVLDGQARTFILVSDAAASTDIESLEAAGAEVIGAGADRVDLAAGLAVLEESGITSTLAEGGGELLFSLFDAGLVDELSVYIGSIIVGGRDAPTLVDGEGFVEGFPGLSLSSVDRLDDGVLLRYEVLDG